MNNLNLEVKKIWDHKHQINDGGYLSGCLYDETIDFLKVRNYIKPDAYVLEIGVGLGYVTKGLHENKTNVSCLEISDVGAKRVEQYCEKTYMVDDLNKLPSDYFDVIICHNVIQHIPTDLLIEELRHCIRSLKIGGVFALEFVSNDMIEDMGTNPSLDDIENGRCCRTPEYLEKLISGVGGNCELVVDNKCNIGIVKGCHVFHVRRIEQKES